VSLPSVLIIDEESGQHVGADLEATLQRESIYRTKLIGLPIQRPIEILEQAHQLVIAVLSSSIEKAKGLLAEFRAVGSDTPLLLVIRSEAISNGFFDPLAWTKDVMITPLREPEVCFRVRRLTRGEPRETAAERIAEVCGLAQLVGEDAAFVALKRRIPIAAQFESTVLLTGETGTGKERFARALHYCSRRSGKPFLPVNCGAIPIDLFENEMYGHQKGAFTGAFVAQSGLILEAEGGTIFLDEIETLSLANQVKVLRFLQDQTYYAVGSAKLKQANVWIIASTNVDLARKVQDGTFREDLYYRLAVIRLNLPSLRQRTADIPLLARHFWNMYQAKTGGPPRHLSTEAIDVLCQHSWPGNIRELQNVIQQILVFTESQTVQPDDVPIRRAVESKSSNLSFKHSKALAVEQFERAYVGALLRTHRGNVTDAALAASKDRRSFGRLVKKYRIDKI
jgi:two-component system response regulator GlrR